MPTQTGSLDLKAAKKANDEASKVATNYLAIDTSGVMVYDGSGGVKTPSTVTGQNVLIDSDSVDIRYGQEVLAAFGETARIGRDANGYSRTIVDEKGVRYIRKTSDGTDTELGHIGYGEGTGLSGYSEAPFYTFGVRKAIEQYSSTRSYAVGDLCWRLENQPTGTIKAAYRCSTAISSGETWNLNHWQQLGAINGNYSVAEGVDNTVTGYMCHAEGKDNIVAGYHNHVQGEGNYTGYEAVDNFVSGKGHTLWGGTHRNLVAGESHAVHYGAETPSDDNLVVGIGNWVAGAKANTVIGRYATVATDYSDHYGQYAFRIGNGTSDSARSNALTVDWNGGIQVYLDSNGTSSADATSGEDMDLFNAIRALGWYSDVIV